MTSLEIMIALISLCSAGAGGVGIKFFCLQQIQQPIEVKVDESIDSLEVDHPSNHTIEDIVTYVAENHKKRSKEGNDTETQVDISINFHSITHEERQ